MPKLLLIVNRFNLGGPTYIAANLAKYLSPEFETLLIGGQKDETEDSSTFVLKDLGIRPFIVPEMRREINPKNDLIAYQKIKSIIKKFQPDIVHTHASKAGMLGRRAAHRLGVPVILHTFHGHVFHSYFNNYKSKTFQKIEKQLAKISNKIIAISESQKLELAHKYEIAPDEKFEVVPVGIDLDKFSQDVEQKREKFRARYKLAEDELAVGIVGRLVPVKNHALFLQSINKIINNSTKKVRFFIVGDGEKRDELFNLANELKLDFSYNGESELKKSTLTFTSWIKDVDYVYAGLDIVALTSLNEGTPISLIEAQAANKPIVSTNVGGIGDIVIPNETALLSKNGNINEFVDNMVKVINDDVLRLNLSTKGYNSVYEKYHYKSLANNMKELYYRELQTAIQK